MDFPSGASDKETTCQCRTCKRHRIFPGSGRSCGEGNGNPSQYSCLKNPRQRSLAGYSPCHHKESHRTKQLSTHAHTQTVK